ncbi:MAG TPA: hypothetical protein VJ455_03625 [Ignavibacteria bacterium]|nr:hypothetical protein [Ignavibacteria bacterium]
MIQIKKIIIIAGILKYDLAKVFLFICVFVSMILFLAGELNYDAKNIFHYFLKSFIN